LAIDAPGIAEDSQMLNLFSVAEEMSDDIVDGLDGTLTYKPYTPDDHTNVYDDLVEGGVIDAASVGEYPPLTVIMDVPLGMLKVAGAISTNIRVDVLSIYEM